MIEEKLIGTWRLQRFVLINKTTGKAFSPYGDSPIGTLIFSADHVMTVAIMSGNRENLPVESIQLATEQQKSKLAESYMSYSGTWKLEGDKVIVHVLVSLLPNWTNKEHFRYVKLTEDQLLFRAPEMKQGENEIYIELSWTRFKA